MRLNRKSLIIILGVWLILIVISTVVAQTVVVSVRGVPKELVQLKADVIFLLEYKKAEIGWDKSHVSNYPPGATIGLENDATIVKEDWITQADNALAEIQARIDAY